MSTVIYTPYFYIIQHSDSGMYYAGSKYGKDANPQYFMVENGYTTSSNIINEIILNKGIDIFNIIKVRTFDTGEDAYNYETSFLLKVDAKNNNKFYNMHNNDLFSCNIWSEKRKEYISNKYEKEGNPFFGKTHTDEKKEKWSKDRKGLYSGDKHPRFKGYYITPFGIFSGKTQQNKISWRCMRKWCMDNDRIITFETYKLSKYLKSIWTFEEIKYKTYKEIGFSYRSKA